MPESRLMDLFPGEVYFEYTAIANVVRVAAVCSVTGTEVVVMGPASASQVDLERLALRKLARKMSQGGDA